MKLIGESPACAHSAMSEANRNNGWDKGLELYRWMERGCVLYEDTSACDFCSLR